MCSALIPPRPVSISMTSFLLLPCRVFVLQAPEAASKWIHDNSRTSIRRTTHHYHYYCCLLFKLSPGWIQFVIPSSPPSPAQLELCVFNRHLRRGTERDKMPSNKQRRRRTIAEKQSDEMKRDTNAALSKMSDGIVSLRWSNHSGRRRAPVCCCGRCRCFCVRRRGLFQPCNKRRWE